MSLTFGVCNRFREDGITSRLPRGNIETTEVEGEQLSTGTFAFAEFARRDGRITERGLPVIA